MLNTFYKKNHDYGNSFELSLDKHGLVAGVVRMEDKMNRLSTLVDSDTDAQIASESLVDTLMDLSNYAAMSACWLMHKDDEFDDDEDDEFIKNWSLVGDPVNDTHTIRSRTTGQYFTEDDNPELFKKIYGVLRADSYKKYDRQMESISKIVREGRTGRDNIKADMESDT